jgi:hypothetical protein
MSWEVLTGEARGFAPALLFLIKSLYRFFAVLCTVTASFGEDLICDGDVSNTGGSRLIFRNMEVPRFGYDVWA